MSDEKGIDVLLEKADLQQFLGSFIGLGATKVSHFVDIDKEMMANIGLTQLQMKRLVRIFHASFNHETHTASSELGYTGPTTSGADRIPSPPSATKTTRKQSVLTFQGGKLQLSTSENMQEKKPWEKYLYPHPKTDRMKFYNSVIEDIHLSTSGSLYIKHASYLREQQSFRWDVHVRLEKLSEKVEFYNNSASGIPKYCNITKENMKKCDPNVCTSLLFKVEASVKDAEKLDGELKQRRERLLQSSNISGIKKGYEEEHQYLTIKIGQLQENIKRLSTVENDLNRSLLLLSRSRLQLDQTSKENARRKRRNKENKRKVKTEKKEKAT